MMNVFVIGAPKSGTSLVMSLLDSHPSLFVLSEESDLYPIVQPLIKSRIFQLLPRRLKVSLFLKLFLKESHFRNYSTSGEITDISGNYDYTLFDFDSFLLTLKSRLLALDKLERGLIIKEVFNSIQLTIGSVADIVIEKTPRHTFYTDEIREDFKDSRFIFVERDFSDNYRSYSRKHDISLSQFSDIWLYNKFVFQHLKVEGNVYHISYEELVQNPVETMQGLSRFLSINYSSELVQPTKFGKIWLGNSMFGKKSEKISKDRIGGARQKYENPVTLNASKSSEIFTNEKRVLVKRILKMFYD